MRTESVLGAHGINVDWNRDPEVATAGLQFGLPEESEYAASNDLRLFDKIPGHENLYRARPYSGPEGVLLKGIRNMQDALACNGLFFFREHAEDSNGKITTWMMYVGQDLHEALATNTLGVIAGMPGPSSVAGPTVTFKRRRSWDGFAGGMVHPGGDFIPRYVEGNLSIGGGTWRTMGVVSGATRGYGFYVESHGGGIGFEIEGKGGEAPATCLSYMSSIVAMARPFDNYMRSVKSQAIALVDEDLKEFYTATFDSVLAAFPRRAEAPTLSVPTFWRNNDLSDGRLYKCTLIEAAVPGPIVLVGAAMTNQDDFASRAGSTFHGEAAKPASCRVLFRPGYSGIDNDDVANDLRTSGFAGGTDYKTTRVPFMMENPDWGTYVPVPVLTGEVTGLKVGLLRDGHVLARSLVDGLRYADTPSSVESLGELINMHIDKFEEPDDDHENIMLPVSPTPEEIEEFRELKLEELAQVGTAPDYLPNIFQQGTLPRLLEEFSAAWDLAAKAAAEASV